MWGILMTVLVVGSAGLARGYGRGQAGSCPAVCVCKWKGGKQAADCIEKNLITLPELVDPETQVLDVSSNNLQILPREAFMRVGLLNLQKVYLRHCKLGQIDRQAFKGLTNLVELDISNNLLTAIPDGIFGDVPFMRDLTLSHNPIQKVDETALESLSNLVKLDLSHCELQSIAPKAFKTLSLLESLKLNANKLTELRPQTVETLNKLRSIELHDNPWTCDCRLRTAKAWLTEKNNPYSETPKCVSGPSNVMDKTFGELSVDDFACQPQILHGRRYFGATAGENATVICRASGVPSATVNWYLNGRLLLNDSAFSSHQKTYVLEEGIYEKKSTLILTNAQESDSGDFYCVAENKAGNIEVNFTLRVAKKSSGMSMLGITQIIGMSAAIIFLTVLIIFLTLILLMKLKREPRTAIKTTRRLEVASEADGTGSVSSVKAASPSPTDDEPPAFIDRRALNDVKFCNPVQKPPRLNDMPYATNHYEGHGSIIPATHGYISPTTSAGNNPDLINDTKVQSSNEIVGPAGMTSNSNSVVRPASGEYSRETCDSLYPSGLWEQSALRDATPEAFLSSSGPRATNQVYNYDDKTPIIGNGSDGSQEELGYASRTFPRAQAPHGGYPLDYGLPMVTRAAGTAMPAKTLRVWQRGGVPVLPPVTALKRAFANRNSPDEGYQEGCGTDV